jgi:AraC family transcriptional regulator of arabinose operon
MTELLKNISQVNISIHRGKVVFGDVDYQPGGFCGPRVQSDYQLVVIHGGSLDLSLEARRIAVEPGHAILLSPGHREHFLFSRDAVTHHSWCSIQVDAVPAPMRRVFAAVREPAPFASHLAALLKIGLTQPSALPAGESLENSYFLGIGLALLSGFAISAKAGAVARGPADEAKARLDEFVSCEYGNPLRLSDLSRAAGVSRQHLMKLFRERGWPTPTECLYRKRLETAADLLSHTGLSVGEIASRCGFANAFHFSRKFRLAYGRSPRDWRVVAWK